jgi:hypothetical protein
MAYDVTWRVSDRAALARQFELMFAISEHRELATQRLVDKFIEDVSLYPVEWPSSAEPVADDEWRFGQVTVRFRRHPLDQLIEVLEVRRD